MSDHSEGGAISELTRRWEKRGIELREKDGDWSDFAAWMEWIDGELVGGEHGGECVCTDCLMWCAWDEMNTGTRTVLYGMMCSAADWKAEQEDD